MKTIDVNLYKFSELSEEAKEKAIQKWRNDNYNYQPWFIDEANKSFEKFADLFSIDWRNIDYCEPYRNEYSIKLDDQIKELSGQRLATYIWNNFKRDLFKGKFYFKDCYTYPNGKKTEDNRQYKRYIKRYSKIFLDNSCVLTGVCYDQDLLQPIYDFLNKPTDIDFETLLNDCIYSLCHSVSAEIEYQSSDEAIIETIEANDYDFLENGELA
jgi:hypothetical protein